MHGLTCLGGIIRNASNMPEFFVHFGILYNNDTIENQTSMKGWWNLEHCRRELLDDGKGET
jgi:hypothetical protein